MKLLGGKPSLMHLAYYRMTGREPVTFGDLIQRAHEESGPFGDHLRSLRKLLSAPQLLEAMRQLVRHGAVPDADSFHRLSSAGLCVQQNGRIIPSCDLYRRVFGGSR